MNRRVVISLLAVLAVIVVVISLFTMVFQAPDGGPGPIDDENAAAGVPEPGAEPTAN